MIELDPNRTALLVMDLQADILTRIGARAPELLERTARVIAAARAARVQVVYVVLGFRPGYPEVSAQNATFAAAAQTGRFVSSSPGSDIPEAVRPNPNEPVVVKHRVGAFPGTDLEMLLRARGVDTLLVAGVATSGVVLSSVRHAADADYRLVVIEDCCADADEEVHRVLVSKVLARQATVVTSGEAEQLLAVR